MTQDFGTLHREKGEKDSAGLVLKAPEACKGEASTASDSIASTGSWVKMDV